jgi:hypothetical protein
MALVSDEEMAAKAREETFRLMGLIAHYAGMVQGHLEPADDPGALWDMTLLVDYVRAAAREFKPIREALAARREEMREAAE